MRDEESLNENLDSWRSRNIIYSTVQNQNTLYPIYIGPIPIYTLYHIKKKVHLHVSTIKSSLKFRASSIQAEPKYSHCMLYLRYIVLKFWISEYFINIRLKKIDGQ